MAKERNALKAGIFMVVSLMLIVGIILSIKGFERWVEPRQTREVHFKLSDDVGGLRPGDEVRVGGVREGEIRRIDVAGYDTPEPDDDRVVISVSLPRRVVLRENAVMRVQSTLTGVAWLNVESIGSGAPLADDAVLAGKPGSMNELFASAAEMVPEINATVRDIRSVTLPKVNTAVDRTTETVTTFKETGAAATDLVAHVKRQVDPLVQRFVVVGDRTGEVMAQVRDILGDSKGDIRGLFANVAAATAALKEKLPGILDQVDTALAKMNTAVDQTNETLADLKVTAANAKDVSASVRSLIVTNRGKIDDMVSSLRVTGDNLKAASVEIRHSPWRLLYKPKKGEIENMTLYDSARQFAEGANELNDAATALRDALKDPQVEEAQVQRLVEQLDESFGEFQQVEDALWKRVKQ